MKRAIALISVFIMFLFYSQSLYSAQRFYNYQSILSDEGGNLLPDGEIKLYITIYDENMDPLYEEVQDVEIISGIASVMVGSGRDLNTDSITGGVESSIFAADKVRYLEVAAEGYPPETLMEIVDVPRASVSDIALGVEKKSIKSDSIRNNAIKAVHLSDDALSKIEEVFLNDSDAPVIVRNEFENYKSTISGGSGAEQVGVNRNFIYSGASNVQGVLSDIDLAIKKRDEERQFLDQKILSHTSEVNPHNITAETIGAVSRSYLFDHTSNKINIEYIPDNIVVESDISVVPVGRGSITYVVQHRFELDDDAEAAECIYAMNSAGTGLRYIRCPVSNGEEYGFDAILNCTLTGEIIYEMQVSSHGMGYTIPDGFKRYITIKESRPPPTGKFCQEVIEFQFDPYNQFDSYGPGTTISWQLYKRQIQ